MSALREAVARAIRSEVPLGRPYAVNLPSDYEAAAAAAIRVVRERIEALPNQGWSDAAGAGEDMRQAVLRLLEESDARVDA